MYKSAARYFKPVFPVLLYAAWLLGFSTHCSAQELSDLDLTINHYNRELTPEGVLHESRYQEKMMRRNGHVWTERVLPKRTTSEDKTHPTHEHKDFNYIVLPRLVTLVDNKINVAFINTRDHQQIYIAPTEYENVNFDGSWLNTYYLIDPGLIANMLVTQGINTVPQAQWYETKKNGLFQRVLWNEKLSIPLVIETGDLADTFLHRIQITPQARVRQDLPWKHLQGFTQKEYSDFLD